MSCNNTALLILVILSKNIDCSMLFEFDTRLFSLKLVPFLWGKNKQCRIVNAQLKVYLFSFSDAFLICFKKIHKKVI